MFNKNFKKQVFTGLAAVALFAPMAFGGNAHASLQDAFNQNSSQQAANESIQQGRELEQQQGAYAEAHKSEIDKSMNAGQDNGTPEAKAATAQAKANHDSSSNNQKTNDPDSGADTSSNTDYNYTGSATDNNNSNNNNAGKTFKEYKDDKSGDVKYPNAPKGQRKSDKSNDDKQLAKQLNGYGKKIHDKAARNDLKKITKDTNKLHESKDQKSLKLVAKYVHGTKNRHNFTKVVEKL